MEEVKEVNSLNPLIPASWHLYANKDNNSLCVNGVLLDGLLQENWGKEVPNVPTSDEYLEPSKWSWPLFVSVLSNDQTCVEEICWKNPGIPTHHEKTLQMFKERNITPIRKLIGNESTGPYSLFFKEEK